MDSRWLRTDIQARERDGDWENVHTIDWSNPPPIPRGEKGRLRWDYATRLWHWLDSGSKLSVVVLHNGAFRVNRIIA